ncbi:MAG: hypothetical protein ABSG75_06035 [Syntrophales bacterium]
MNNKNPGWVKLWRDQFTHEISGRKPWCDGYAWSYLYSRANYRPAIVNFRNQYIHAERGQFVTSELKLSKIFGWSRRRTKSFLTSLEIGGMCDIKRSNRFVVITIRNYDKFQSTEDENATTDVTTGGQQEHIDKNIYKDKNIYMSNSDFNLFYQSYPKHEAKKKALNAWLKIRSENGLLNTILLAVEKQKQHKNHLKSKGEFCPEWPLPATWLNGERWKDEIPDVRTESQDKRPDSSCPRCKAQIPPQDRTVEGCIHCENKIENGEKTPKKIAIRW